MHPALVRTGLSIFQCVEVSDKDQRVRVDLDIKCYSGEHIAWCSLLGIPNILIWGIGIPTTGFILLIRNRKQLDTLSTQKYLLMLYQGLHPN